MDYEQNMALVTPSGMSEQTVKLHIIPFAKIVKSTQSCSNGHLPYHLFILLLSAHARSMNLRVQ